MQNIKITKKLWKASEVICYSVYAGTEKNFGFAEISFHYFDGYFLESSFLENIMKEKNIKKFCIIEDFFPNGYMNVKEYQRKGVGSRLLDEIISDSKNNNSPLLLVETPTEPMKNFLRKKGFTEYQRITKPQMELISYYKII